MKFTVTRTSDSQAKPCDEASIEGMDMWNEPIYWVEINTLEELMAFIAKYGRIVLYDGKIEIYDDYRE